VEVKRTTIAEAAFAFGMAPEALGVTMGNSSTYSNIKDWWRAHRDFALSPWADTIGGTLTALTPAAQSVAVDLDGHSRPDENDRIATYAAAIDAGIMTVDEARAREGLPPLGQEA
jgi:phage portal protein BeeE